MERAVRVGDRQHLGNPLLLRRALDHGVRVVVAHCATMGVDRDLDRGADGPYVESFALCARLMDDPLPGIMPLYSMSQLVQFGVIGPRLAPVLAAIREPNPLQFDFVLKRRLRAGGKRFPENVFETRPFFTVRAQDKPPHL